MLPTLEARLQLAGTGPEEGPLRALARERGIDEDVEFLGSVADVPALLARCSFTVLPSLSEGMPNAVLESLAHGRAVVASAVGGVPEILGRGGGVLVPPGDPSACRRHAHAAGRPALAARLGAEGRVLVHDGSGSTGWWTESLRLYQSLLDRKSSRRADSSGLGARPQPGFGRTPACAVTRAADEDFDRAGTP